MHSCDLTFERLPTQLPIFPLAGVLLLPHGQLPLNIFEARYMKMVDDALRADRIIGIVQPKPNGQGIYDIGCAGRIVNFAEAEGGRYLITLAGVSRFRIGTDATGNELPYRRVVANWQGFEKDMCPLAKSVAVDRAKLNRLLQSYFRQQEMSCDWDKVDIAADTDLLTALEMICPLKPAEKQALLEADNIQRRTEMFLAMIEMAVSHPGVDEDGGCCH